MHNEFVVSAITGLPALTVNAKSARIASPQKFTSSHQQLHQKIMSATPTDLNQYLLETQSLFQQSQGESCADSTRQLHQVFGDFKCSLREYLSSRSVRGLDARKHFMRAARKFNERYGAVAPRHRYPQERPAPYPLKQPATFGYLFHCLQPRLYLAPIFG
ncbi:hypothetical protein BCR33DRAFT_732642 [Rhizoclosmatium globosum]|uniref:Uncharacterized protein n=1 Tax=Rhizoclosmatium globosum TaxID=329046 RepID=A0A1Y2D3Y6_9FUNG|nr:hypothetical protein BCR33DRAFT_732642 [Rhizoclosmatium globosum]|eukprot:ORY53864.1 hypothetical protein BCR33DRAFT_732642 [Rhizoclosmatium globosum]